MDDKGWKVSGRTGAAPIGALRKFAEPWFKLPADFTIDGTATIDGSASDAGAGTTAEIGVKLDAINLTNEAITIVAEKLAATARLRARLATDATALELEIAGAQRQALLGPMLLDLGANPLNL